jgi:hypothetical protein
MKGKVSLAMFIVAILVASALIVYYLESGPNSPSGSPSLSYFFNNTILYDSQVGYYGGSFLGWKTAGSVFNNETDAVSIRPGGSLSRQFEALSSEVRVSFDWLLDATMIVSRQLNGVYGDLTYSYSSENPLVRYANTTSFDLDNSTKFTVRFESSGNKVTLLYSVLLWNSVEFS